MQPAQEGVSPVITVAFIGDVVGKPGRTVLKKFLSQPEASSMDAIVVNIENSAGGFGINVKTYNELKNAGVNIFTSGNHIYDKVDVFSILENSNQFSLPINFKKTSMIQDHRLQTWRELSKQPRLIEVFEKYPNYSILNVGNGFQLAIVSLLGKVFMENFVDCPFQTIQNTLNEIKRKTNLVMVDFHAETTSEKQTMGWFLDGKVSALLGTHTHVQTADECIMPSGSAYITDVGMTGAFDSVLGMDKGIAYKRLTGNEKISFEVAKKDLRLSYVVLTLDTTTGKALSIVRKRYTDHE